MLRTECPYTTCLTSMIIYTSNITLNVTERQNKKPVFVLQVTNTKSFSLYVERILTNSRLLPLNFDIVFRLKIKEFPRYHFFYTFFF